MSTTKIKTYVLIVSTDYPKTHKLAGEKTHFPEKILNNEFIYPLSDAITEWDLSGFEPKLHTIRANFLLWEKRIWEVHLGKAELSIRIWSGKPYNSKQIEICRLTHRNRIGVQKIEFSASGLMGMIKIDDGFPENGSYSISELAKNDGLSLEDFKEWFKNYDLSEPLVIIHFTSFRY